MIISVLIILIGSNYLNTNQEKFWTKIVFQIVLLGIIFDLVWLILMASIWSHKDNDSEYWNSLSWMHNLIYYFSFVEIIIKGILVYLIFANLGKAHYGGVGKLLSLKY